jgi:hypothetical protein
VFGNPIPIRMFLGLPDPVSTDPDLVPASDPSIIKSSSKNSKKNIHSSCFFDFLPLKNDVNVASKSNKQKKQSVFHFN